MLENMHTCIQLPVDLRGKNLTSYYYDIQTIDSYAWISNVTIFAIIRESVDSLCRDDADMPMPPYIRKACNRPNAAFVSLFR